MIRTRSTTSPEYRAHAVLWMSHRGRRVAGFSLIELLISVTLGLIVLAGLINLFVANNRSYQVQSANNFLQENVRIASDRISWSLRMADFWGGNEPGSVKIGTASAVVTAKGNCNGSWATAITGAGGGAIYGYDGAASFPFDATCIDGSANYVPGSDVLIVRYANPQMLSPGPPVTGVTPAESATISGNPKEIFLLATSDGTAQLFPGNAVPAPVSVGSAFPRYAYPYQIDMYYLRSCSVISAGTACSATSDGGMPLPTLMRMHLQNDGTFISDAIVDGVEQLAFEYGVATDSTNVVPVYMTASAVTLAGYWPYVVSVRVSLVAVNPTRDITVPHVLTSTLGQLTTACTYTINNQTAATITNCPGFTAPYGDKPWQFVRASQQFVAQLRNRVRG